MQIGFSVGAKAARLIGRENITDVDGALVELIKNAYDADASCVWVNFSMPFPDVPDCVKIADLQQILSEEDFSVACKFYEKKADSKDGMMLEIREELSEEEKEELQDMLFSYNKIVVIDNGSGMSENIVRSSWMYIGTSNKETQVVSPKKKRVRTGAKGIGRFALDKLSTVSHMYTQEEGKESALYWSVDWNQFASARLINEVKARLEYCEYNFETIVRGIMGRRFEEIREYGWKSGTAFVLTPVREAWSERLFQKVNTNLRSINPIGTVDQFDVIVRNEYQPNYNFKTEKVAISKDDYDYRIKIDYDGDEKLQIKLLRNEVDIKKKTVVVQNKLKTCSKTCRLEEFWQREKLQKQNYMREDYAKEITLTKNIMSLFKRDKKERIREVGPFTAELYFLRNTSNEHQVMKKVKVGKRRELLSKFSGVKIYRDDFKVRPYGDEGSMQDWIGMGMRAQKSPASVAHPTGQWRVQPYQMIGFAKISREKNSLLEDKANREGIAMNNTYYIFVDILRECLKEFEFDRQYIYREYAKWIDEQQETLETTADRVKAAAVERAQNNAGKTGENESNKETASGEDGSTDEHTEENENDNGADKGTKDGNGFTEDDYLGTVYGLMQDKEKELNSKQIMQVLSSSGIVLNTFFHEFNAINTQFHVRTNQLKSRFDYLLQNKEYTGISAYDPYKYAEKTIEKNDRLVAALLDVIMEGLKKPNLVRQSISLKKLTGDILSKWKLLLSEKYISVYPEEWQEEDCVYEIAVVDWYIILNNVLLNAAWFLERETNADRRINFSIVEDDTFIQIDMDNNGPPIAEKFRDNPDKIFELGETSKEEAENESSEGNDEEKKMGTGLGLWVVKETVERYGGSIHAKVMEEGFGLCVKLKK